jgi:NADH-quinone oxidoreductase subunit H
MIVVSAVATAVYLGGWYFPGVYWLAGREYNNLWVALSIFVFVAKMALLLYLYFWMRWTFPRYRYDQLMDLGWKWMIPASLVNIVWTGLAVFAVQALDGWRGFDTIESLARGLNLTRTGQAVMVGFGLVGVLVAAALLTAINWRSRDFNLKKQRREVRLVSLPQGKPAVATTAVTSEP